MRRKVNVPRAGAVIDCSTKELIDGAIAPATRAQYESRVKAIRAFAMTTGLQKQDEAIMKGTFVAFMNYHKDLDEVDCITPYVSALRHHLLLAGQAVFLDEPEVEKAIRGYNYLKKRGKLVDTSPRPQRCTIDAGDFPAFREAVRKSIPLSVRLKYTLLMPMLDLMFNAQLRQVQVINLRAPALREGKLCVRDKRCTAVRSSFDMIAEKEISDEARAIVIRVEEGLSPGEYLFPKEKAPLSVLKEHVVKVGEQYLAALGLEEELFCDGLHVIKHAGVTAAQTENISTLSDAMTLQYGRSNKERAQKEIAGSPLVVKGPLDRWFKPQ